MKKTIGIGFLASLALVGLASCGEDDKPVTLIDANGESYTVKETDDAVEVKKVISSLMAIDTTAAEKVKASISVDTNIVEKDAAGNVYFKNKVNGKGVAALDLSNANYTSVDGLSNWTSQNSTAFLNNLKVTPAYIDVDFTADMVSLANPNSTGKADIDATIYQNEYKTATIDMYTGKITTTKNVVGVYANIKKSDIEGFGDVASEAEDVGSLATSTKFYVADWAIFSDASSEYYANNALAEIQNTIPSFEVAMGYLSEQLGVIPTMTIDDASDGIIYFKNVENNSVLPESVGVDLTGQREVIIGVDAKSGRVRVIEVEYDDIKSLNNTHTITKDEFEVKVKLNYDSKASVKGVAKGTYYDMTIMYQMFSEDSMFFIG